MMTIAVCAVLREGVVLGADSTTTRSRGTARPTSFYDHAQKVFEVGEGSALGLVTWGNGSAGEMPHRTVAALLGDSLSRHPAANVQDAAERLGRIAHAPFAAAVARLRAEWAMLRLAGVVDAGAPEPAVPDIGYMIGGVLREDRVPEAAVVLIRADDATPPTPRMLRIGDIETGGANAAILRVVHGADPSLVGDLLSSGRWTGTPDELQALLRGRAYSLDADALPLRDGIYLVQGLIRFTVAMVQLTSVPTCGGAVEIATVSTDRPFRWVRHKSLDVALD